VVIKGKRTTSVLLVRRLVAVQPVRVLHGKRILITRPPEHAEELAQALRHEGAVPIHFSTIHIAPIPNNPMLDQALHDLTRYEWVIFTSVNAIPPLLQRISASAFTVRQIAVIGAAAARALHKHGITPTVQAESSSAKGLIAALQNGYDWRGVRVLFPCSEIARRELPDALREWGAVVDAIPVYRTEGGTPNRAAFAALHAGVEAVTFFSPSAVTQFVRLLNDDGQPIPTDTVCVCLGKTTADAAHTRGFKRVLTAETATIQDALRVLKEHFQ